MVDSPSDVERPAVIASRPWRLLALLWRIPLPYPFDGVREKLRLGVADAVAGAATEQVLVLVALGLEHLGHAVVGLYPVVHAVAHDVRVEQVRVADGEEHPDGFLGAVENERLVEAPRAVGHLGVE